MVDCENLAYCSFFKGASKEEKYKGLIVTYCRGDKQDECMRKRVSKALGGPENVPSNMMPNGSPLLGSDGLTWSDDVTKVLKTIRG
jgi:hypothetical protein